MKLPGFGAWALLPLVLMGAARGAEVPPIYSGLSGKVMLDNARVRVEKFVLAPGASTGRHSYPADQLVVFVKGGTLKSMDSGRSVLWKDGRVRWHSAGEPSNGGSTNVGTAPIEMIWVTVKPVPAGAASQDYPEGPPHDYHLNYPNIPGEDLLENERVVVQRFVVNPEQWEGVHAHLPNMLYIHIKGGQWAAHLKGQPEHLYPQPSPDGSVGWMDVYKISQGHESGNKGKEPIDLIWVTLKD